MRNVKILNTWKDVPEYDKVPNGGGRWGVWRSDNSYEKGVFMTIHDMSADSVSVECYAPPSRSNARGLRM